MSRKSQTLKGQTRRGGSYVLVLEVVAEKVDLSEGIIIAEVEVKCGSFSLGT